MLFPCEFNLSCSVVVLQYFLIQMGNSNEKEILDTISSPENETALRALFQQFDKNKSGSLDKKEWAVFGKYLYKADVEKPLKEGEKDVC